MSQATDRIATNRALGRQFFAEQDRLRGGPAAELCHPDYTAELGGNPPMDRAGHEGFAQMFYAAFPDMAHTVDAVIADEEGAAVRFTLRGTHTRVFMGIPATGRPVTVVANVLMQVVDGRVARLQGIFDEMGMLRQLGVMG